MLRVTDNDQLGTTVSHFGETDEHLQLVSDDSKRAIEEWLRFQSDFDTDLDGWIDEIFSEIMKAFTSKEKKKNFDQV